MTSQVVRFQMSSGQRRAATHAAGRRRRSARAVGARNGSAAPDRRGLRRGVVGRPARRLRCSPASPLLVGVVCACFLRARGAPSIAPANTTVRQIVCGRVPLHRVRLRQSTVIHRVMRRYRESRGDRSPAPSGSARMRRTSSATIASRHLGALAHHALEAFAGDAQRARAFERAHGRRARRRVEHGHLADARARARAR